MGQNSDYVLGDNQSERESLSGSYTTLSNNLNDMCNEFVQQHNALATSGLWESPAFDGNRVAAGSNLGSTNFGTFATTLRQWQQHMVDALSSISSSVINQGNLVQAADNIGGLPGGGLPGVVARWWIAGKSSTDFNASPNLFGSYPRRRHTTSASRHVNSTDRRTGK